MNLKIIFSLCLTSLFQFLILTTNGQITQVNSEPAMPQTAHFKDFSTKNEDLKSDKTSDTLQVTNSFFYKNSKVKDILTSSTEKVMVYGSITPVDSSFLLPAIDTVFTFTGQISNNQVIPAEPRGAVSPNYIITATTENITFHTNTGQVLNSIVDETFWVNQDNTNSALSIIRTTPYYDSNLDRFVLFAQNGQNLSGISNILIAVSQSSNPTGSWTFYKFKTNNDNLTISSHNIYLGYNKDWFIVSTEMSTTNPVENSENSAFVKNRLFCFKKQDLFTNQATTPIIFDVLDGNKDLIPARVMDNTKGTISLLSINDPSLAQYSLYQFDGSNLSQPSIKLVTQISLGTINKWFYRAYNDNTLPQKNMSSKIDGIMGLSLLGLELIETTNNLWATHGITFSNTGLYNANATFYSGIQWLKFDIKDQWIVDWGRLIDTTTTIYNGFRVSKNSFCFPALMVNNNEDITIVFKHFSPNTFPSIGYAVKLNNEPYFRKSKIYRLGKNKYFKTYSSIYNKWGFNSSIILDPQNQKSFWLLGQYAETATTQSRWGAAWAKIILP